MQDLRPYIGPDSAEQDGTEWLMMDLDDLATL